MTIDIRGIPDDRALRARIARRMGATLALLRGQPVAAVAFFDDDGPKGGVAIRCALTVRLPPGPPTRVERTAETPRLAFDRGFETLKRRLARDRQRARDRRRRKMPAPRIP